MHRWNLTLVDDQLIAGVWRRATADAQSQRERLLSSVWGWCLATGWPGSALLAAIFLGIDRVELVIPYVSALLAVSITPQPSPTPPRPTLQPRSRSQTNKTFSATPRWLETRYSPVPLVSSLTDSLDLAIWAEKCLNSFQPCTLHVLVVACNT